MSNSTILNRVAFIIGGGSNVGIHVALKLRQEGYHVALGSRNPDAAALKEKDLFPVSVDGTSSASIKRAFDLVRTNLGEPGVVVYNVGLHYQPPLANDPLSVSSDDFAKSCNLEHGVFVAAQEALASFRSNKDSTPKVFISTGNLLPFLKDMPPSFLALASQKVTMATMMDYASRAYAAEGIRFHYATLVGPDGAIPNLDPRAEVGFFNSGPAHAEAYWNLISADTAKRWDYRFTYDGKPFKVEAI
ncbi:hypothetical protein GGU10DRAFT_353779 [Lentinula aff. detonsa]|uniref:NAD(P)-binding protein n=1 Tax=Lentinula aff. detonsa TaxID=2804958 RepID=A0AA38KZK9_9AGAR|nr:hypothetical protein GGU10DRAFT_353779 [Lentinula aff. detonsa]